MTTQMYSKSVQKRVDELLAVADRWAEGVDLKTGVRFVTFASSRPPKDGEPMVVYRTRLDGKPGACTCPGARKSKTGRCCHGLACRAYTQRVQEQAAKPTKLYEDYYGNEDSF